MSKKKKRKNKKRKSNSFNPNIVNIHHCLWIGSEWNKGRYAKELRNHWYFKVAIPMDTLHKEIHNNITRIHVPSESNCLHALNVVNDLEHRGAINSKQSVSTRLELLICILDCIEPETTAGLKQQLEIVNKFYRKGATQ